MVNSRLIYIRCLSAAIRGEKIKLGNCGKNIKLKEVFKIAQEQDTVALIYNVLKKEEFLDEDDKEEINELRKGTFIRNLILLQTINSIENAITTIAESVKKIIVLKGMVLRQYYPFKEARTMGDVDIIVEKEELENVTSILNKLGFKNIHQSGVHREFENDKGERIEVHWELINTTEFKTESTFDKYIWANLMPIKIKDTIVYSLNNTDLLTHLCIHMAVHKKNHGFGFRQVCDLVLLIEKEYDNIDWKKFKSNIKELGIEKFTEVLFKVCNKTLDLEIPEEIDINKEDNEEEYINQFIEYLFIGGVHGKTQEGEELDLYKKHSFFIKGKDLNERYSYAKKNKILLPIAWIHRGFVTMFSKKYAGKEIIDYLINSKSKKEEIKQLNDWLEI